MLGRLAGHDECRPPWIPQPEDAASGQAANADEDVADEGTSDQAARKKKARIGM